MPLLGLGKSRISQISLLQFAWCNANFWLFISLVQFFGYFCQKNCSNKINSPKIALAKYFWKVLKNRSNEIRTNEIRIRRELPVFHSSIIFGAKIEISGTNCVEKAPIFGSKLNKLRRQNGKKTKKFQKPKSCRQLP